MPAKRAISPTPPPREHLPDPRDRARELARARQARWRDRQRLLRREQLRGRDIPSLRDRLSPLDKKPSGSENTQSDVPSSGEDAIRGDLQELATIAGAEQDIFPMLQPARPMPMMTQADVPSPFNTVSVSGRGSSLYVADLLLS